MNYEPNIDGADGDTREGAAEIQLGASPGSRHHAPHLSQVLRINPVRYLL
jgi:hypothetical protein